MSVAFIDTSPRKAMNLLFQIVNQLFIPKHSYGKSPLKVYKSSGWTQFAQNFWQVNIHGRTTRSTHL